MALVISGHPDQVTEIKTDKYRLSFTVVHEDPSDDDSPVIPDCYHMAVYDDQDEVKGTDQKCAFEPIALPEYLWKD